MSGTAASANPVSTLATLGGGGAGLAFGGPVGGAAGASLGGMLGGLLDPSQMAMGPNPADQQSREQQMNLQLMQPSALSSGLLAKGREYLPRIEGM